MNKNDAKDAAIQDAAWNHFGGAPAKEVVERAIDLYDELLEAPGPDPDPDPDPNPDPKTFRVFDNIRYREKPSLEKYGLEPLNILYAFNFFPGGVPSIEERNFDMPSDAVIANAAAKAGRNSIIDIEHWWPDDHTGKEPLEERAVQNYVNLMAKFRDGLSSTATTGYYSTMVRRNYFTPVRGNAAELTRWQIANDKGQPIESLIDATYPSLYTFYKDEAGWVTYAKANINEAKRLAPTKPCYPYLWPAYHPSGKEAILPSYWRLQLETCMEHADGCVIWTLNNDEPWSQVPAWWDETKAFMREIRGG